MVSTLYHGGIAGLKVGDVLRPSPPHITDNCPVCRARAAGRIYTVGEFRAWLKPFGRAAEAALRAVEGAPDNLPVDPPTPQDAVYLTSHRLYARWYAARSKGDLYRVKALGALTISAEDHFPSWTVPEAQIVEVLERRVMLHRNDRRMLSRQWAKADREVRT